MAEGGHFSCSICFEDFGRPKVLPCGHTFCCQCVKTMVGRNSYFTCPTCRKDICLPESGKVEDFATNFALLALTSDEKRIKKDDGHHYKIDSGCTKHKIPTKFYCKLCKKPVCAECLLQDHKPDTHTIATTSDMAVIFSRELEEHLHQLKVFEEEGKSLGESISKGLQCYEENRKTLQDDVKNALERKQEMLKKCAENLMNELNKKGEQHTRTYTDLQEKHSNARELSSKIQEKCDDLHHHLRNLDLSHASKLEEISIDLKTLKESTDSLKTICRSTPTEVGLTFQLEEATCQLGKLHTKLSNVKSIIQPVHTWSSSQGYPSRLQEEEEYWNEQEEDYCRQQEDEEYWYQQEEDYRRQQEEEGYWNDEEEDDYYGY